jgi:hypothetical protein
MHPRRGAHPRIVLRIVLLVLAIGGAVGRGLEVMS